MVTKGSYITNDVASQHDRAHTHGVLAHCHTMYTQCLPVKSKGSITELSFVYEQCARQSMIMNFYSIPISERDFFQVGLQISSFLRHMAAAQPSGSQN